MILDDIVFYRKQQLEREMSKAPLSEVKKAAEKIFVSALGDTWDTPFVSVFLFIGSEYFQRTRSRKACDNLGADGVYPE